MNPLEFTNALSKGVFHHWDPYRIFMYLTAYIDESGTHDDSSIVIIAGVVGHAGQWRKFEKKWGRMLLDHKLPYFHAKEIENGHGIGKGWTTDQKRPLYKCSDKLTAKYSLFQFIAGMKTSDYMDIYKVNGKFPKGIHCPDSMYGLCVRYALSVIPLVAESIFGDRDAVVNVVLESGNHNYGDAV